MATSCSAGVYDCEYDNSGVCANYNGDFDDVKGLAWPVAVTAIIMCVSAFAIGANDSANAWGTSVGSSAISLKYAVVLAAVTDFLGAVTLGYGVSDTIQKGVSEITDEDCWACGYCDSKFSVYAIGMFGASLSSAIFLMIASFAKMPVSATHAIVGAVVGMTVAGVGFPCLDWSFTGLGGIVTSWFLSPILAGFLGAVTYVVTKKYIMEAEDPRKNALLSLPIFYSVSTAVVVFVILAKSDVTAGIALEYQLLTTFLSLFLVAFGSWYWLVPFVKSNLPSENPGGVNESGDDNHEESLVKGDEPLSHHNSDASVGATTQEDNGGILSKISGKLRSLSKGEGEGVGPSASGVKLAEVIISGLSKGSTEMRDSMPQRDTEMTAVGDSQPAASGEEDVEVKEYHANLLYAKQTDALFCFKYLVVYIAALMSFAHGANDTANSTATFSAVYTAYQDGLSECDSGTEIWIMVIAGACSSLGTILLGYKVIETVGKGITQLDFHKAFCANIAAVVAVVVSTIFKFPVSTTHCSIGAVICIGYASNFHSKAGEEGKESVAWGTAGKIAASWFVTVPVAALFSAAFLAMFTPTIE